MYSKLTDYYCWIFGAIFAPLGGLLSFAPPPIGFAPWFAAIGIALFVFPFVRQAMQRRRLAIRGVNLMAMERAYPVVGVMAMLVRRRMMPALSYLTIDLRGREVRVLAWVPPFATRHPGIAVRVDPENPSDFYCVKNNVSTPSSSGERLVAIIGITIVIIGVAVVAYVYR